MVKENIQVQDAIAHRLEIIGEAVKYIPLEVRRLYPNIPRQQIAGRRDILIHSYFGVKTQRVWEVIEQDLPELKQNISRMLQDLNSGS